MTCCIAIKTDVGLVFLADSRTNAGMDQISIFRKMRIYENPGDRVIIIMSAGNLSLSQAVLQTISEQIALQDRHIWSVHSMYEVAQLVGDAVRTVHQREANNLQRFHLDFNTSLLVGGQIRNEQCRLFQIYPAGNFIESSPDTPYFQIGEGKYGKPLLDAAIVPAGTLEEASKAALIAMEATLRLNLSVGMPLDLLAYETGALAVTRFMTVDEEDPYYRELRQAWAGQLRALVAEMPAPAWKGDAQNVSAMKAAYAALKLGAPQEQKRHEKNQSAPDQLLARQVTPVQQQALPKAD